MENSSLIEVHITFLTTFCPLTFTLLQWKGVDTFDRSFSVCGISTFYLVLGTSFGVLAELLSLFL